MKKYVLGSLTLVFILVAAPSGYADRRSYVWTYEYTTMPKGMVEVEYYLTSGIPDTGHTNIKTWKHFLELEYGITDRWDAAMYQMWKHERTDSGSSSKYDGFKLRSRYRFAEKGKYFIDPEFYVEYIRDADFSKANVGEVKLILAKDIGKVNISYNQIWERDLDRRGKTANEYSVGSSYELWPVLKLGIESTGNYADRKYALGPALSFATDKFWVALGSVFGVSKKADDVQARMIVGVSF